ncbi:hypothetical protein Gohar_016444 [Gossypium harknessii]|uniref:Uncharacterized protein n=1 Tax=Gossypium harknessii TaxID=34285 RepID=A0A7J9G2X9_9ROSI|nr:hypothetical protein [Gossypium harknessii]
MQGACPIDETTRLQDLKPAGLLDSAQNEVEESISSSLNQVLDTNLHNSIGRKCLTADNCALAILQVGLECSVKAPDERLDMKEIVTKLKKIKVKLLKDIGRVR